MKRFEVIDGLLQVVFSPKLGLEMADGSYETSAGVAKETVAWAQLSLLPSNIRDVM